MLFRIILRYTRFNTQFVDYPLWPIRFMMPIKWNYHPNIYYHANQTHQYSSLSKSKHPSSLTPWLSQKQVSIWWKMMLPLLRKRKRTIEIGGRDVSGVDWGDKVFGRRWRIRGFQHWNYCFWCVVNIVFYYLFIKLELKQVFCSYWATSFSQYLFVKIVTY